ncbi:MAG TPA: BON domain-containing protein [Gemmataceae bacterium]|nr:BON domain-containing protein [Gemmataceae bacterium]
MSISVCPDGEVAAQAVAHVEGPAELAEGRLRRSSYLALRGVSCAWDAGVLTLRGRLPSYYLKQVAQASVAQVGGVERVENRIEVVAPDWAALFPV